MRLTGVMRGFLRAIGRNPILLGFRGTTDGSGDITLVIGSGSGAQGAFSAPTRSTATYTITIGSFKSLRSFIWRAGTVAQTITSITPDGAAGTIVVVMSAAVTSTTLDVLILVDT